MISALVAPPSTPTEWGQTVFFHCFLWSSVTITANKIHIWGKSWEAPNQNNLAECTLGGF